MSAPYSFTGFYIALVVAIVFNILGVIMAFIGASYIVTTPTVALNATITANNKTAAELLNFAGYIGIVSIILLFIMFLIVIFLRSPVITGSFTEADYYAARFGWGTWLLIFFEFIIVFTAIILAIVGISYVNTSTNNAASANARFYGIIAAIAYAIVMLPLFYIIYAVYEYNSYLYGYIMIPGVVKEVQGIALFSLNTNPNFPGTIIDGKVTVDTTYQPPKNIIYIDGIPVESSISSKPITKQDVFNYSNGIYVPTAVIPTTTTVAIPTTTIVPTTTVPTTPVRAVPINTTTPTTTVRPITINRNANPFGAPRTVQNNPFV
jgi:hypothetical protein